PVLPEAEVEQEITARLGRAECGDLDPDQPLYFSNGTTCTAETLRKALDNIRLRDPLEPDYGPSQAVLHWNNGNWVIVSWAHGIKKPYRLVRPAPEPPLPDDAHGLSLPYRATPHGLVWSKPTRDGFTDVPLSNFTAVISAEITEDDGAETRKRFVLTAQLQGQTYSLDIPAAQFAGMNWV